MVSSLKPLFRWKKPEECRSWHWIRQEPSQAGEPRVTDLVCEPGYDEKTLLELAGALEKKSEHPLAKAVLSEIVQRKISTKVEDFRALAGNGLTGTLEGHRLLGGSMKYISSQVTVGKQVKIRHRYWQNREKPIAFCKDDVLIGMIAVADVIKEDSPKAVQELQNMGIRVVMLTGDNEQTRKAIGAQAGSGPGYRRSPSGWKRSRDPQIKKNTEK